MANSVTYILKGYGNIDPAWVKRCFNLFREQDVNIRKLLLLKNGHPDCFSMLEVHFILPEADLLEQNAAFIGALNSQLAQQAWLEQSLGPA